MTATATDIGRKAIPEDVLEVLKAGGWSGDGLGFTMPQVDRKLYQACAKVLKACGGKWNRAAGATLFPDTDAMQSLLQAAETGEYYDLKKAFQQFDTPTALADRLAAALLRGFDPQEPLRVLEPSAGQGNLAEAVLRAAALESRKVSITAVEIDGKRADALSESYGNKTFATESSVAIIAGDFMKLELPKDSDRYDAVIMNPPFTRSQDMQHVRRAAEWLKSGGELVSIMSPGFTFRQDRQAVEFQEWFDDHGGVATPIPPGAFKEAGANIRTVMVELVG